MSSFKEQVRVYKFTDARLIQICNEKIAFAVRDAIELATVGITEEWVEDLQELADAFAALPSDDVELGEQQEATDEKNVDADELRDKLKELRSAAIRAFGEKHGDYKQFALKGLDDMGDDALYKAGSIAHGVALTQATPLLAKGWDATDNTALEGLVTDFKNSMKNKSIEVGSRDSATENRVVKGNELYDLLEKELCEAGKSYWRTISEAKHNDYIIYNTASGTDETTAVREDDVLAAEIKNIDVEGIATTPLSEITIVITLTALRFYFSEAPGDTPGAVFANFIPGTYTMTVDEFKTLTGWSLVPGIPYLNVQNTGGITGHYKLTFTGLEEA